jgi:hypothetical protein
VGHFVTSPNRLTATTLRSSAVVFSVFETAFADILLVAPAAFVVYTDNVRMSVRLLIVGLRNHRQIPGGILVDRCLGVFGVC